MEGISSLNPHPIVEVFWVDACYQYDAEGLDDLPEPKDEETVGYLLEDSDTGVVLAMNRDDFGYRALVRIPRAYVQSMHWLNDVPTS